MSIAKYIKRPLEAIPVLSYKGWFCWLSDEAYLKLFYKIMAKESLNLEHPKTFNEKMQWLKLHDRKPIYTAMVDKYEVKKYVAERIGEKYIIPTLGAWDKYEDIDFDKLPNRFVLKCTHDSGGLVICKNKNDLDKKEAKKRIKKCLKKNFYWLGREWPYKNVKPRILAEKYMGDGESGGITDYKFFCFDGEPKFLYLSRGLENHSTASISFVTLDWKLAPFTRSDFKTFTELPKKPAGYDEMLELAKKLSSGHKFLRVDLYQIGSQVYFSELTFFPCGGVIPFDPKEWDEELGKLITLDIE